MCTRFLSTCFSILILSNNALSMASTADGFTTIDLKLDNTKLTEKVTDIDTKLNHHLTILSDLPNFKCTPKQNRTFDFNSDFDLAVCIARYEPYILKTFHRCLTGVKTTNDLVCK